MLDRYFTAKSKLKAMLPALRSLRSRAAGGAGESAGRCVSAVEKLREVFRAVIIGQPGTGRSTLAEVLKVETEGRLHLDILDITGARSAELHRQLLDQSDAVICILDATDPWAAGVWGFLSALPTEVSQKLIIVVHRSDLRSEVELEPVLTHILDQWNHVTGTQCVVTSASSKLVQRAISGCADAEGLRRRGRIDSLCADLDSLIIRVTGCSDDVVLALEHGERSIEESRTAMGEIAVEIEESDAILKGIEQLGENLLEQSVGRLSPVLGSIDRDIMNVVETAEHQLSDKSSKGTSADRAGAIQSEITSGVGAAIERSLAVAAERMEGHLEKSWAHVGRHLRENHEEAVRSRDLKEVAWKKLRRPFLESARRRFRDGKKKFQVETELVAQLGRPAIAQRYAWATVILLLAAGATVGALVKPWGVGAAVAGLALVPWLVYARWKAAWARTSARSLWDQLDPHREHIQQVMAGVLKEDTVHYRDEFRKHVKQLAVQAERFRSKKEPVLSEFSQIKEAFSQAREILNAGAEKR